MSEGFGDYLKRCIENPAPPREREDHCNCEACGQRLSAEEQADEARAVAKDLFDNQCRRIFWKSSVESWESRYPWLREAPAGSFCGEERGGEGMSETSALEPVLAAPDDPWCCPLCGESYRFQTHPCCLKRALRERDEAANALNAVLLNLSPDTVDQLCEDLPWLREWIKPAEASECATGG